jgi:hypothetical protein
MQAFLSGYTAWGARHRQRHGHLFQGRYNAEIIEDESYYWTVSRYIHLNPVRAGLVARPEAWEWSSYPGYTEPARRYPWVAHRALLDAWKGEHGGDDPVAAYRSCQRSRETGSPALSMIQERRCDIPLRVSAPDSHSSGGVSCFCSSCCAPLLAADWSGPTSTA